MAKQRSRALDYLVYVGFRLVLCIAHVMPINLAVWLTESVADLLFHFDRSRRETTLENLRRAFPNRYSETELRNLARRVYRHFATVFLEVTLMGRKVNKANMHKYVELREYRRLKEYIESDRPVIVLTAHFGNWEYSAHCLGLAGVCSSLVARTVDNPHLDAWFRATRERTGHKVISKTGDVRRMNEVLADGGVLCTLGDQDAGSTGMFVEFFGRPASTHKAIARLAQRTGAVIAVVGMQKTGGLLEYTIRIMEIIKPEDYADQKDATLLITQRFAASIEEMVRLDPAQYLWLHRRWKHQPPLAKLAAA